MNLLIFPLQAKRRMSAMFVHRENGTGGRFSKWRGHTAKKTSLHWPPLCPCVGRGDRDTPRAAFSAGSPPHPGADQMPTSQSRWPCVATCLNCLQREKVKRTIHCVQLAPLSSFAISSTCTEDVAGTLEGSSLSSPDLSGHWQSQAFSL